MSPPHPPPPTLPTSPSPPPPPRHWLLLTYQRTCSNLLSRVLSAHPALLAKNPDRPLSATGYFFFVIDPVVCAARDKPSSERTPEDQALVESTYQACWDEFSTFAARVGTDDDKDGKGKSVVIKEHVKFLLDPAVRAHYLANQSLAGLDTVERDDSVLFPPPPAKNDDSAAATTVSRHRSASNTTILSDALLDSWGAFFLIRHPALVMTSQLRADSAGDVASMLESWNGGADAYFDKLRLSTTVALSRQMYTYLLSRGRPAPPVIDADDVINRESGAVAHLCRELGIDEKHALYEWTQAPPDQLDEDEFQRRMTASIDNSTGIMRSKSAEGLVIDDEVEKWKGEFGADVAERLAVLVRAEMVDYMWMRERRLYV